jgi:succinate-semialdehyde dehydrogenase / glutarate-semialdehyde dehydrogenase
MAEADWATAASVFRADNSCLADVPQQARIMREEPFGPVAIANRFVSYEATTSEANRLPYGLAAYASTSSARTMSRVGHDVRSGMVSINHHGLGLPELPFGGIRESGYGSERRRGDGGDQKSKLVTQAA